jgi:hypothetical protein
MAEQTPDEIIASSRFYPRKPNPVHQIIIDGTRYIFEWSEMWGPLPMTRSGRVRELGHNHKIWRATGLWSKQGKRVDEYGVCVWEYPPKERVRVRPISKRSYLILPDGAPEEPGDKWVEIDSDE